MIHFTGGIVNILARPAFIGDFFPLPNLWMKPPTFLDSAFPVLMALLLNRGLIHSVPASGSLNVIIQSARRGAQCARGCREVYEVAWVLVVP
jgi:hypothetical protein